MKKDLLLFLAMASAVLSSAQCSELFFSMYVCASGNNKGVEIYNPTNAPIVLTGNYRVSMYDNGHPSAPSVSRNLTGTIGAYSTFVFCNGQVTSDSVHPATGTPYTTPPCDTALQNRANQLDTAHFYAFSYFNGDDALSLDKNQSGNWVPVDYFANINDPWPTSSSGSHVGWWNTPPYNNASTGHSWTKYHSLIRKPSVKQGMSTAPAPGTWNVATEWDSLPNTSSTSTIKYYPTKNNNSTATGTHFCNCNTSGIVEFKDEVKVSVFPNPSNTGIMTVVAGKPVEMIQVYNLIGKLVYEEKVASPAALISFSTSNLAKGTYLLKSSFGGNMAHVSKIILQ
jgi:hypothetical protein